MKKENMNNKGFSLVELIIVIAIMAILIVVLAPQYLKYVERSRNSTDMQNARTLMTAVETYAADPQSTKVLDTNFDITITTAGGTNNTLTDTSGAVDQAIKDAGLTLGDIKCSSKTAWASYKLKGKVEDHGGITWTFESYPSGSTTDNGNLSNAMKGKATT
ncbi:MAG: type II secretion system protein [Lachnospiraceae bacterium]|nr:type II secretion system protein [Lachnospiraceae bacterium]